jgi:glycosyltransferase involved in cell wall biosynthesis
MSASIVIMTGSHLCHNPRALKEATSLARAGHNVVVLGAWINSFLKELDQQLLSSLPFNFIPVVDSTISATRQIQQRVRRKLGSIVHQFGRIENRWQLGYVYTALRQAAHRRVADLYIAHSEQAMAVALDLLRDGRRVGVDMEDWFSEDLLSDARRHRPLRLLRSLESELLTYGAYSSCPSRAMSEVLAQQYRCSPPAVVYNAFPWSERSSLDGLLKDRKNRNVPSIHWFSQTLGAGRGLEDLVAALPLVHHAAEIHLRGNPAAGFESWLWKQIPENWRDQIFVHDIVSNEELLPRIAEHDIGFAGEMKYCRSRDLTVTNKILHYILAGLAVVASDTTGQCEVAKQAPDAVSLYSSGNSSMLAAKLNVLLASPNRLRSAKNAALQAAKQTFCWERQEKVLLQMVAGALVK